MMPLLLPLLLGLAHGFSDASAGFLLGRSALADYDRALVLLLTYNLVAFGGMPLAGLLSDRFQIPKWLTLGGLLATLSGLALANVNLSLAIPLAGIGSACFHAGAGSLALTSTPRRAAGPGLFAAFGVVGLALGGQQGVLADSAFWPYPLGLALLAALIFILPAPKLTESEHTAESALPVLEVAALALVLAIALRSSIWTATQYALVGKSQMALIVAFAALTGKLLGGFLADRIGWRNYLLGALALAGILFVAGNQFFALTVLGALALQSATPATLAAMARALPNRPGLAASLALGTGIILGGLPSMVGWSALISTPWVTGILLAAALGFYWLAFKRIR